MDEKYFLAGDIGGTKTNLALYSLQQWPSNPLVEHTFKSQEFSSLEEMLTLFLDKQHPPVAACFGVAGPVFEGRVKITKLSWSLSENSLQRTLNVDTALLINDLTATGHSLPFLQEADYFTLNHGKSSHKANKVIIAPGTGLGEALLTWNYPVAGYDVHPSEGGHALFAPANEIHLEIIKYLYANYAPITYDKICSGPGISLIYDFFKVKYPQFQREIPPELGEANDDQTPAIVKKAIATYGTYGSDCPAVKTLEVFVEILASEAANAALRLLAGGGVYLAGGIPVRIMKFFKDEKFMSVFTARPPFTDFLVNVPVKIITNPKAALVGSAAYGIKNYTSS